MYSTTVSHSNYSNGQPIGQWLSSGFCLKESVPRPRPVNVLCLPSGFNIPIVAAPPTFSGAVHFLFVWPGLAMAELLTFHCTVHLIVVAKAQSGFRTSPSKVDQPTPSSIFLATHTHTHTHTHHIHTQKSGDHFN